MAAWVFSLIMLRGSRPAASPSSPARLNLVFDPGRSRRALGVRPQEEDGRPARSISEKDNSRKLTGTPAVVGRAGVPVHRNETTASDDEQASARRPIASAWLSPPSESSGARAGHSYPCEATLQAACGALVPAPPEGQLLPPTSRDLSSMPRRSERPLQP